jgi:uncharacterized protein YlxW (UPF0749 family)
MGLLNYLTATSLDEDYAHASARRARQQTGEKDSARRRTGHGTALVVLALFGVLVATAFVQTARTADDAAERHDELVKQVLARRDQLQQQRARAEELRAETARLQDGYLRASAEGRALQDRLERLGLATGADPAQGPGVRVRADDGPASAGEDAEVLDVDLQKLVNGLWLSGAEAVAVNGERLTALSAIRLAGANITVNYERISPPYTVTAIGDPANLAARFVDTPGGQWWLDLQALYGVQFQIDRVESLTLPASSRVDLRHARTTEVMR